MLPEFAETVKDLLAALPPEKWGNIKVGTDTNEVALELGLDPEQLIQATKRTIFIMPIVLGYALKDSGQRGKKILQVITKPLISSALVIPFTTFKSGDVGNWEEISDVLILREKLEFNIMGLVISSVKFSGSYTVEEIEPEPPQEIELNGRKFLGITDYTYEVVSCV